jgi:fumarate reductase flavoprotein subunit
MPEEIAVTSLQQRREPLMNESKNAISESIETEIAIVGGGGAGLAAAVAAAEKGAEVVVLEKRHILGGNSAMAEGLLAVESPAQKRMNIDVTRDDVFRMAMNYAHFRLNPRIVRAFIDKSGDTIQWLEGKGLAFEVLPLYPHQRIRTWHCLQRGGVEIIDTLSKECKDLGVRLFRETGANKLFADQKGNVSGIVATTKDKEFRIKACAAIIATGGYGGNNEMLKKYCLDYNENMYLQGIPNMGDGLLMATEIGAATEGLGLVQFSGHTIPGASFNLTAASDEPNMIWVNKKGERFIDESAGFNRFESVNAVLRQPDKVSYTLFDESIKENIMNHGVIKGLGRYVVSGKKLTELGKILESEARKGNVKISNSWDEIAKWMGINPQTLKATIDEYNSCCDQRHDGVFAKDPKYLDALRTPPCYAIRCYPRFLGTIGGIKVNHHMEVLAQSDEPIPGLFAAGVDTGGWEFDTYNAVLSGSTFGFAINSGRIAGENAADLCQKNHG